MENIFFNNEQKNFYNLNPTPNELPRQSPYYNKFLENVYLQPNQGSTQGILFDPTGINDPTNWSLLPQRQPLTEAQVRSETQALSLLHGDVVNATLLSSNGWGTDSSQALLLRQMLGKPAFNEIVVNEEDVNDNNLTIQEAQLNAFAKTDLQNPENLLAFKKQSEVVAYLKARLNGFEPKPIEISAGNFYRSQGFIGKLMADTLDFDFKKSGMDVANWLGLISDDNYKMFHNISYGGLPSTSMTDIVAAVEKFDKNFDPKVWFNTKIASDPYVKDGLLNYGVTEDTFYRARNETHAKMMLMSQMNISNIQQHISDYLPNNWQKTVGFVKSFKDGLVASGVDVVAELGVDLGISAGISLIPTGVTQAAGVGKAGFSLFKFGSRVASWGRWGLTGELPRYAMQWGVVRRTLATAAVSGGWGAVADYAGQQNNIALANSLYYYNPEMKSTFDWDEVGNAAMTGALFGGSLGVLGSALSSISPAFHNARVKRLAAAGLLSPEQAKKAMQQSPFSITLNNFKRLTNGSLFKNVDPIAGTIHTAVSQGKQPELADINDASRTAANAVDVAEATTKPDQADTTLKPSLDNRGVREELIDYVDRGIRGGTIKSIGDVLNNLSPLRPWNSLSNKQQVYLLEQLDVPSVQKKLKSIIDDPAAPDAVKKLATDLDSEVQLLTETKAKLRSSLTAEDVASIDEAIKLNKPLDEVQPATTNPTRQTVIDVFNAAKNNTAAPSVTATPEAVVTPSVAATPEAVVTPKEPAIKVTQERVDAATTEAKADMDLRTESELKDPRVEQEIKDNVEEMLFGRDGKPTLRRILRGSRKARKLSPAQQKRITTVLTNPAAFIEEARGNKEHITAYYNKMKEFVAEGRLTEADVRIILAATVNLNWNSGAASIISKLVGGTRYSVDLTTAQVTVGEYLGKSEQMLRVQNVLHEVGHVFEILSHGSSLMNMRKLFSSEADFIVSLQEVLDTDKVNKYYIAGNTQELMAEAFSVMMIDEVRLAAFLSQAPNQGLVRKMLMQKFVSIGQSLLDVLDSLKLSKVLQEEQVFKTVKEMLLVLDKNSGLLISRVMYQNTVVDLIKDSKQLTTKELKNKLNRELIKRFQPTQDELTLSQKQISYLFTEDEVAALVEYTSSEQATPLHIDAFLNTKLDGLDLKKNRDEFIQTMTGYLNINKKYFSSVIDIYNQALVENGYEPIKRSGLETEISPADITQYLNTIKKTDQKVDRKTMLSTPDVLMNNYFSYSLGKTSAKLGAPLRVLKDLTLIEQPNKASVLLKRIDGFALLTDSPQAVKNTVETLGHIDGLLGAPKRNEGQINTLVFAPQRETELARAQKDIDKAEKLLREITDKTLVEKLLEGLFVLPKGKTLNKEEEFKFKLKNFREVLGKVQYGLNTGELQIDEKTGILRFATPYEDGTVNPIAAADARKKPEVTLTLEQEKLLDELVQDLSTDKPKYPHRIFGLIAKKIQGASKNKDAIYGIISEVLGDIAMGNFAKYFVKKDGTLVDTQGALIGRIASAVANKYRDAGKKVTLKSSAGLTPKNWRKFIEDENQRLEIEDTEFGKKGEKLSSDKLDSDWLAAEKRNQSQLFQKFEKEYKKVESVGTEQVGTETIITEIERKDTGFGETIAARERKEAADELVEFAKLGYEIYGKNKLTVKKRKFVVENYAAGLTPEQILEKAKEAKIGLNSTKAIIDTLSDVRVESRKIINEEVKKRFNKSIDEISGEDLLYVLKELQKPQEPRQVPPAPSRQEIIEQVTESIEQQNEVKALDAATETTPPNTKPTIPIIKPEETVGPVTVVANRRNKKVTPLTPHVDPAVAEKAMDGRPSDDSGQLVSSGVRTRVDWTTASAAAWHNADGMAGNLFFSSLKTIQAILNGVSHPKITKENAGALLVYIKQLYKDGKEKEAINHFLELMKKLDIKAVRVVDPRTGQTTMKFLFSEYEWSYGGITREEPAKKTVSKPTTAPKAAPRASKEKPIPQPSEKPKATEAKPMAAKRTVKVTVERGPDNKDIPVIEPVEKPDTTTQTERLEDTKGSDNRPGTDLPLTTEAEQIMVGLTESNESLRDGGTDASSFKYLLAKFFKSLDKKTRDALQSGIPDVFKEIFLEFVDINSAIMHRNRERFKNDPNIVQKFWKQVTKLLAEEDANRVSVKYYKAKTLRQIYNEAAQSLSVGNNKFTPPLIPDNITIKNGRMSIRGIDKNLLDFINNRDKAPIMPPSKEAMAARQKQKPEAEPMPGVENSKPKEPEVAEETPLTKDEMIDNVLEGFSKSSSMLLRLNNLISWIFGGSERSNRNIWRTFMSKDVNFIQSKSRMGSTIRSMQRSMRVLSALFDDSRTMIGQLVAPGATPLRSANKAKLEAVMLVSNLAKIHRAFAFEISKLELTNAQVKVLQRLQIEAWQKKTSPTAKEIQDLLNVKNADDLAAIMDEYRTEMIHINKTILDLERKTDWREVVDKNGDAIPEDEYLPIQIVIKKLNAILVDNKKYSELIRSLVETRKQSKLNDEKLDINTLIVMGILDIKDVKTFYTRNREFVQTEASNLDSETLANLFVTTVTSPDGLDKYFGVNGKKYFTIQKGSDIHVFKVPETIDDLSKADLDKYYKTVSGSAEHVLDKWKTEFSGLSLIEVEMRELLDYKAKRGRHARKFAGTRNDRPDIDTNHYEDHQSTVRNFSTEEILGNPELFELARTDLHAAYQNFVRYRAFDLLFQETIDKLAGQTGLRPKQFLMLLEQRILKYIDEFDSIKPEHKEYHKQDVYDGITRLLWQYAEYNGSTPKSGIGSRQARNAAKSLRGVINMSGGVAYGAAQSTEAIGEFIKSSIRTGGLSIPVGIFRLLSNLLNVHVRGNSHQRFQIEDLATSLDDWHQEHTTHFNEGVADANFDMDLTKPYSAIWETPAISGGMSDKVADILNKSGQTAVLLGGVTDNTNLTRYYAKARHFRKLLKMIKSGKLRKFLELREEPTTRAEMARLQKLSEQSAKAERQLAKIHKRLAREAGLNEFDAIYAVTSGLVDIQSLDAISWGLNQTNALDGIIDFRELHLAYRDLVNMSNPSIDPEVYKRSIVAFQDGIERRIRKRSVTTLFGLNKAMGLLEGSETGKLLGAVTSYMSSYFDDVMLDAPNRGSANLVLGSVVFFAVLETMVGLFREWASGRDVEDILQELESDPEGMVIRVATRMPIMGAFTPLLETAIRTVHSFTGGSSNPNQLVQSMVSTGVGGSPAVGINSALSLSRKIFNAAQGVFEDDPTNSPGQKILAVPGHFINKSPLMIPARILEERANMDDTNALQWILNGIQTPATPYASRAGRGRSGGYRSVPLGMETYTPKPQAQRNFAKEQAMQIPRVPPSMQIPRVPPSMQTKGTPVVKDGQVQSVKVNTQGVSPLLPELLGGSQ